MTPQENTTNTNRGTVLVTGGAGFIGCAISSALVAEFDSVVAIDSLHPQIHASQTRPDELDPAVDLVVADITEAATWDNVLSRISPNVVIHLAAETGTGQSLEESTRHAMANVVGTTQMLDGLNRNGKLPRRVVLSSSRAVYGEGAWRSLVDGRLFHPGQRSNEILSRAQWDFPNCEPVAMSADVVAAAPVSVYGATKLAQENIIQSWARAFGVETAVLRLQNVYGPGQSLINPYTGIMSLFCRMAKAGESIPLYEDGEVRRDFVLIDDVAAAIVTAAVAEKSHDGALDIGSGEFQTIRTAAELISRHYGAPAPHVTGQFRQGDVRHAWAAVEPAKAALPWEPQFKLETGITRLAQWIDGRIPQPSVQ